MSPRTRRVARVAVAAVFAGLVANAWWHTRTFVILLLAGVGVVFAALVAAVMWSQGTAVTRHAARTQQAIEQTHGRKEVTR